jgi:alkylhydroperoxidase family enzyme
MKPIDHPDAAAKLATHLTRLEAQARRNGLQPCLTALVCLRVAQMDGHAALEELHTAAARAAGETQARLAALDAWPGSALFTERERAALECSEAITLAIRTFVPEEAFQRLSSQLAPEEIVDLALLAAQSHVPAEIWRRLTCRLTQAEIADLSLLVAVLNTRNRFARSPGA